eukprot:1892593-Rhodomonas_salina.2
MIRSGSTEKLGPHHDDDDDDDDDGVDDDTDGAPSRRAHQDACRLIEARDHVVHPPLLHPLSTSARCHPKWQQHRGKWHSRCHQWQCAAVNGSCRTVSTQTALTAD